MNEKILHNPAVVVWNEGKFVVRLRIPYEAMTKGVLTVDQFLSSLDNAKPYDEDGCPFLRLRHKDHFELRLIVDPTVDDLHEPPEIEE